MVRIACHAGGREFESRCSGHFKAYYQIGNRLWYLLADTVYPPGRNGRISPSRGLPGTRHQRRIR